MPEKEQIAAMIRGCCKQDEYSQISLYRHYYSFGMGLCRRYAHSHESALEMLNDGFLKVFQRIDQYDQQQAFMPWLRKVLVHSAIDHYRKYDAKKPEKALLPITGKEASSYNEALDQLEFDDLIKLVQLLPAAYRISFNLYVVEGMPHKDIANTLGISIGTSKSNLSKARQKIKDLLNNTQGYHLKSKKYG